MIVEWKQGRTGKFHAVAEGRSRRALCGFRARMWRVTYKNLKHSKCEKCVARIEGEE